MVSKYVRCPKTSFGKFERSELLLFTTKVLQLHEKIHRSKWYTKSVTWVNQKVDCFHPTFDTSISRKIHRSKWCTKCIRWHERNWRLTNFNISFLLHPLFFKGDESNRAKIQCSTSDEKHAKSNLKGVCSQCSSRTSSKESNHPSRLSIQHAFLFSKLFVRVSNVLYRMFTMKAVCYFKFLRHNSLEASLNSLYQVQVLGSVYTKFKKCIALYELLRFCSRTYEPSG